MSTYEAEMTQAEIDELLTSIKESPLKSGGMYPHCPKCQEKTKRLFAKVNGKADAVIVNGNDVITFQAAIVDTVMICLKCGYREYYVNRDNIQ